MTSVTPADPYRLDAYFSQRPVPPERVYAQLIVNGGDKEFTRALEGYIEIREGSRTKNALERFDEVSSSKIVIEMGFSARKLSCVHLAAIRGNIRFLELLQRAGISLNTRDGRGWTAAHHAALHQESDTFDWLIQHGADCKALNHRNATPLQIFRLVHLRTIEPIPGFRLSMENRAAAKTLIADWHNPRKFGAKHNLNWLVAEYEWYRTLKPSIRMLPIPDRDNMCFPVAGREIPSKKIVRELTGEWSEIGLETRVISNESAYFCDSFPNLTLKKVYNCVGLPLRFVLVSICDIKEHDSFSYNFGAKDPVKETHFEAKPNELRAWAKKFSESGFKDIMHYLSRPVDVEDEFERQVLLEPVKYVVDTPTSLFQLICERLIDIEQITTVITRSYYQELMPEWAGDKDYFEVLRRFEKTIQKLPVDLKATCTTSCLKHMKGLKLSELIAALHSLNNAIDTRDDITLSTDQLDLVIQVHAKKVR